MTTDKRIGRYPLPWGAVRALDDSIRWGRELTEVGIAQEHGIGNPRPLTAAERRDWAIIGRAAARILEVHRVR